MAAAAYFDTVQKIFIAFYQRPADPAGLKYWADRIDTANGDAAAVVSAFATSPEAVTLYGPIDATTIGTVIDKIYLALFNKAPDPAGKKFYVDGFTAGTFTAGTIALNILNGATNDDAVAIANKLQVSNSFTQQVDGRALTSPYFGTGTSFNATYKGDTDAQAARDILKTVTASPATVLSPAQVTEQIQNKIADAGDPIVGQTSGQTFTLTAGIDNFTGTAGNDTFIGGSGANGTTGSADQLDGAGGTDTFKMYGGNTSTTFPTIKNIENVYLNATTGGFDASAIAGVTSIEADTVTAQTFTVTTGQKLGLTNIAAAQTITVAGNTPTALDLTLNKVGTPVAFATVALTGTSVATANVTATGANSNIQLTNAGGKLATLNVAGDKLLKVTSALTTLTAIDASANTGGVNVDAVGASNLTFTGGSGNDRLNLLGTLTAADKADGGAGTDTLAIDTGATLTKLAAANIKGFEVLEATGTAAGTLDVDAVIANNALTGIVSSATTSATVNNINAAAVGNISVTQANTTGLTFTAKDFVAGGTSDAATIKLDNSVTKSATGIDVGTSLSFVNADVITFNSLSDGTDAKTIASTNGNSVAALAASDLEKIVVTGNETFTLSTAAATAGLTEVDASGLTGKAALSLDTSAAANTSLLVKATANADTIKIDNAATLLSTIYTGGGSDTVTINGKATAVNTFKFTTTALNAGDLKAGDALAISLTQTPVAGSKVVFDFTSAVESLLKVGGVTLGTTVPDVVVKGATLGANTNVAASLAAVGGNDTITVQFDLNGDGVYTAGSDAQIAITLTGIATGNSTFNYDATNDNFVLTIV